MAEPDSTNSASAAGEEASATTEKSELLGNKVFVPKLSELREVIRDRLLVTVKATATPRTIRLSKKCFLICNSPFRMLYSQNVKCTQKLYALYYSKNKILSTAKLIPN